MTEFTPLHGLFAAVRLLLATATSLGFGKPEGLYPGAGR